MDTSDVCPTEDAIREFLDYLVEPLLPTKSSIQEAATQDKQKEVAKQVHAVVLLYNYYHRKGHPHLEYLGFEPFCKLALVSKPTLKSYLNLMLRSDDTELSDLEKQLSLTEKAIKDACDISISLDASRNSPSLKGWPVSRVAVLLIDPRKEKCFLQNGSITKGVWSMIEKDVNESYCSSGGSIEAKHMNKRKRMHDLHLQDELGVDKGLFQKLAFSAVKEATNGGISQSDLTIIESHIVCSLSKEKTAAFFYVMQSIQAEEDNAKWVPIKDVIDSLQGPLVKRSSSYWMFTSVVEYFHLLPYAWVISQWFSRKSKNKKQPRLNNPYQTRGKRNLQMEVYNEDNNPLAKRKRLNEDDTMMKNKKESKKEKKKEIKQKKEKENKKESKKEKKNENKEEEKKEKNKVKEEDDAKTFQTRMSAKGLFKLMKKLTEEQKEVVKRIGFGSLLRISICENNVSLSKFLIEKFNYFRCSIKLETDELLLTEDDVEAVYGIPRGSRIISDSMKMQHSTEEYAEVLESFKQRWGLTPITSKMPDEIVARKDCGNDFIRDFVVYVINTLIKGNQDRHVYFKILSVLVKVDDIKEYNWCKYTLQSLISAVRTWRKKPDSFFTGPITFLTLIYLDRVEFKLRLTKREYPLISSWTSTMMRKRIIEEKSEGGFGQGKVVGCLIKKQEEEVKEVLEEKKNEKDQQEKGNMEKASAAFKNMASALIDIGEVVIKIDDKKSKGAEKILKTLNSLSEIISNISTFQSEENSLRKSSDEKSDDNDAFYNKESVLQAVDVLVEAVIKTREKNIVNQRKQDQLHLYSLGLNPDEDDQQDEVPNQNKINDNFSIDEAEIAASKDKNDNPSKVETAVTPKLDIYQVCKQESLDEYANVLLNIN